MRADEVELWKKVTAAGSVVVGLCFMNFMMAEHQHMHTPPPYPFLKIRNKVRPWNHTCHAATMPPNARDCRRGGLGYAPAGVCMPQPRRASPRALWSVMVCAMLNAAVAFGCAAVPMGRRHA